MDKRFLSDLYMSFHNSDKVLTRSDKRFVNTMHEGMLAENYSEFDEYPRFESRTGSTLFVNSKGTQFVSVREVIYEIL